MQGKIRNLVEKKYFGFIQDEKGVEYFFHKTDYVGIWQDLVNDFQSGREIKVEFISTRSMKGPRASDIRMI